MGLLTMGWNVLKLHKFLNVHDFQWLNFSLAKLVRKAYVCQSIHAYPLTCWILAWGPWGPWGPWATVGTVGITCLNNKPRSRKSLKHKTPNPEHLKSKSLRKASVFVHPLAPNISWDNLDIIRWYDLWNAGGGNLFHPSFRGWLSHNFMDFMSFHRSNHGSNHHFWHFTSGGFLEWVPLNHHPCSHDFHQTIY